MKESVEYTEKEAELLDKSQKKVKKPEQMLLLSHIKISRSFKKTMIQQHTDQPRGGKHAQGQKYQGKFI